LGNESSSAGIPRPITSCDVRKLPLTPAEGYLLSRVDGSTSTADLCALTGQSRQDVDKALARLVQLGAVMMDAAEARSVAVTEGSAVAAKALDELEQPAMESYVVPQEGDGKSPALYDPSELDEDVDVPPDKRRKVLDVYYRLDELSHYAVLGVEPTADKKAIKSAYYQAAAEYHPDKYFRKNMGSYKAKLEAIFSRVTVAHDTLLGKEARAEYDAYLRTQLANRALEETIRHGGPTETPEAEAAARPSPERAPSVSTDAPAVSQAPHIPPEGRIPIISEPPPTPSAAPRSGSVPAGTPGVYGSVPPRDPERDRIRREAFARRLAGFKGSLPPRSSGPPSTPRPSDASDSLRRMYEDHQKRARTAQIQSYVKAAEEALARNDPAQAANAFGLALQILPDDPELKRQMTVAHDSALRRLAEGYVEQARYEEKSSRWKDAARSYVRAAGVLRDDPDIQERAAFALVKAEHDLHAAAQFGSRAVEIRPKNARYRETLARVYIAAGLKLNARRELEIAAELAPEDANIAKLLKSLR
jgi:curved DNA-binding protein CbpA